MIKTREKNRGGTPEVPIRFCHDMGETQTAAYNSMIYRMISIN